MREEEGKITSGMKKRRMDRTDLAGGREYIFFHFRGSTEESRMLRNLARYSRFGFGLLERKDIFCFKVVLIRQVIPA